jgi:hypothetical protein
VQGSRGLGYRMHRSTAIRARPTDITASTGGTPFWVSDEVGADVSVQPGFVKIMPLPAVA